MQTLRLRPSDIEAVNRSRPVCAEAVTRLAASIKEAGLIQPITVRVVEEMEVEGVLTAGVPVLVAGAHRLEAVKRLGWETVECVEIDDNSIKAEMVELAENLHRLDLTKEQRDEHIRRYAELLQSRQIVANESKRADGRGHRREGIAAQVARDTGLNKRTIERALSPKPKPVIPIEDDDALTRQVSALMSAWNRAGPDARAKFLAEIGETA